MRLQRLAKDEVYRQLCRKGSKNDREVVLTANPTAAPMRRLREIAAGVHARLAARAAPAAQPAAAEAQPQPGKRKRKRASKGAACCSLHGLP